MTVGFFFFSAKRVQRASDYPPEEAESNTCSAEEVKILKSCQAKSVALLKVLIIVSAGGGGLATGKLEPPCLQKRLQTSARYVSRNMTNVR